MIDTLGLRLFQDRGDELLESIPPLFDSICACSHQQGNEYVSGYLQGLKLTVRRHAVTIREGSFCKWYLGDNYQTMGRRDIRLAIEKLSDTLHLPMGEADVTRLDFGCNFIMQHPTDVYFRHLGKLKRYKRLEEPSGIYYHTQKQILCFYDKNRERIEKGAKDEIPELYLGRNVLRYEHRYTKRIAGQFNRPFLTASTLYEEDFYNELLRRWHGAYKAIDKINDMTISIDEMMTVKQFKKMGVRALAEKFGGQLAVLGSIDERYKMGKISKKQAHDLKATVKDAFLSEDGLDDEDEAIMELDKQVKQTLKYFG